jgi:hypothetical protein
MTGPKEDIVHNGFTWIFIIGITLIFLGIGSEFLWREIHPSFPILISFLFISTIYLLFLTQFT